jgi:hypothetical protein
MCDFLGAAHADNPTPTFSVASPRVVSELATPRGGAIGASALLAMSAIVNGAKRSLGSVRVVDSLVEEFPTVDADGYAAAFRACVSACEISPSSFDKHSFDHYFNPLDGAIAGEMRRLPLLLSRQRLEFNVIDGSFAGLPHITALYKCHHSQRIC